VSFENKSSMNGQVVPCPIRYGISPNHSCWTL